MQSTFRFGLALAVGIIQLSPSLAQSVRPAFEVTSVKPAPKGCRPSESPGRVSQCATLEAFIQIAYNLAAFGPDPRSAKRRLQILGGPDWIKSDQYEIAAKAPGEAASDQMHGPMMQVLLEDRFHLDIRRESRELPVYFLTVSPRGLKIKALNKMPCTLLDNCGAWTANVTGNNMITDSRRATIAEFAADLSNLGSDRVIIDKTGLTELFNFHLEFTKDDSSIFTAIQDQLGLKLTAARGPVEVLVIHHVERPSTN